jgi:hypothetical protein
MYNPELTVKYSRPYASLKNAGNAVHYIHKPLRVFGSYEKWEWIA